MHLKSGSYIDTSGLVIDLTELRKPCSTFPTRLTPNRGGWWLSDLDETARI